MKEVIEIETSTESYGLTSVLNFRDLGGCQTEDGQRVKRGVLFRSASLDSASKKDLLKLSSLGIRTICDLRAPVETRSRPDRILPDSSARYVKIPVVPRNIEYMCAYRRLGGLISGKFRKIDFEELMIEQYGDFVLRFSAEFATLLKIVSCRENLPVLIHCTGGKDRTGFACALIQAVLGVSEKTIGDDYLMSNSSMAGFEEKMWKTIFFMRFFGITREKLLPLVEVRKHYLDNSFNTIRKEYTTLEDYLKKGLGLEKRYAAELRSFLVEP
ncbi:putative protein-tyrosine-phosphatase [Chitinispirillum alkaliphilum]|nr:putative protein-tyrosine-phosphatase [Chitinispirillum alkaliphilum]